MNVTMKPKSFFKPYTTNPRLHSVEQTAALARSIVEFGFNQPIVTDRDGVIIVGHGRFAAAQTIDELRELPCLIVDIDPEKAKAYRLADNRLQEMAKWDFELLASELKGLADCDFDMSLLAWDEGALAALMNSNLPEQPKEPEITGDDNRNGRFILMYRDDTEKKIFCDALGISGDKVLYSVDDLSIDADFDPSV